MSSVRSPRQWWHSRVLAPLDAMYERIDQDLAELPDARPTDVVVPASTARRTPTARQARFDRTA